MFSHEIFSDEFYYHETEPALEWTDEATGLLASDLSNPNKLFLRYHDSPQATPKKKCLIVADPYPHLDDYSQHDNDQILEKLERAHKAGFQILLLTDKNQLQQWDGKTPLYNYIPAVEECEEAKLQALAWEQYGVCANHLHILNHFRCNELIAIPTVFTSTDAISIYYLLIRKKNSIEKVIQYYALHNRKIIFIRHTPRLPLTHAKVLTAILDLLSMQSKNIAVKLLINDSQWLPEKAQYDPEFVRIMQHTTCLKLSSSKKIPHYPLSSLFSSANNLAYLLLYTKNTDSTPLFKSDEPLLPANQALYSLELGCNVDANQLDVLTHFAPNLKILALYSSNLTEDSLDTLLNLKQLIVFYLSYKSTTLDATIALRKILLQLPNLRRVRLDPTYILGDKYQHHAKDIFSELSVTCFNSLVEIDLKFTLTVKDWIALSLYAPLEKIAVISNDNGATFKEALNQMREGAFSKLVDISFSDIGIQSITYEELAQFFRVAPNIEQVDLRGVTLLGEDPAPLYVTYPAHLRYVQLDADSGIDFEKLSAKSPYARLNTSPKDDVPKQEKLSKSDEESGLDGSQEELPKSDEESALSLDPEKYLSTEENPDAKLKGFAYFPDIHIARYRLRCVRPALDAPIEDPSQWFKPCTSDFTPYTLPTTTTEKLRMDLSAKLPGQSLHSWHIRGIKPVSPEDGTQIVLPSLSMYETLLDVVIYDSQTVEALPRNEINIEHDKENGFYRINLPQMGHYQIHFVIDNPDKNKILPEPLQQLAQHYEQFQADQPLPTPPQPYKTLGDLAAALNLHKKGSCRHRALAAYVARKDNKARIVSNPGIHSRLEIEANGIWYTVDLGGGEGDLNQIPIPPIRKPLSPAHKPLVRKESDAKKQSTSSEPGRAHLPPLLHTPSPAAVAQYYEKLRLQYGKKECFIATNLNDLSETGITVTQEGIVKPSTRFGEWLKYVKTHPKAYILIIDLRRFKPNELPKLNDLLDHYVKQKRKPPFNQIHLVLIDVPEYQYAPDFNRRIRGAQDRSEIKPDEAISETESPLLSTITSVTDTSQMKVTRINLFHSPYWDQLLLGSWEIGKTLHFIKSSLAQLLAENATESHTIIFENPPLDNPTFTAFLEELKGLRQMPLAGERVPIPDSWSFATEEVPFIIERGDITYKRLEPTTPAPLLVTSTNLLAFINPIRHGFDEKGMLRSYPGYFEAHTHTKPGQTLPVIFSPLLSQNSQDLFLSEARRQKIRIECYFQPQQDLSSELEAVIPKAESFDHPWISWNVVEKLSGGVQCVSQNNPDSIVVNFAALDTAEFGWYVRKKSLPTPQAPTLQVWAERGAIVQALEEGKTVILHGNLKPALGEAILSLTQSTSEGNQPYKGRLIIVTEKEDIAVQFATITVPQPRYLKFSEENNKTLLQLIHPHIPIIEPNIQEDFLSYKRRAIQVWLNVNLPPPVPDEGDDETRAKQFDEHRIRSTIQALAIAPCLMILGETGTGKTHFLQYILSETHIPGLPKIRTFTSLKTWLEYQATEDEYAILIRDEANASQLLDEERCTERFDGLFAQKKTIVWQAKIYELTNRHKVAFAFNPDQYGAGRRSEGFLQDHALTLLFETLPSYYIKTRLIRPQLDMLFKAFNLSKTLNNKKKEQAIQQQIEKAIGTVYDYFCQNSSEILITPRELRCMVNMMVSYIKKYRIRNIQDCTALVKEVAYHIGEQIADGQFSKKLFALAMKSQKRHPAQHKRSLFEPPFSPTDHRKEAHLLLSGLLQTRASLQSINQADIGLGGFLLEGPSGVGKTHFIEKFLKKYYRKETTRQIGTALSYEAKIKQLKEAFQNGAIVIINEFNTSDWPVDLLNQFLMGKDEAGNPPKKPGFFLIITQNPASFAGRNKLDPALRRRLARIDASNWPPYTPKSLLSRIIEGIFIACLAPILAPIVLAWFIISGAFGACSSLFHRTQQHQDTPPPQQAPDTTMQLLQTLKQAEAKDSASALPDEVANTAVIAPKKGRWASLFVQIKRVTSREAKPGITPRVT
jgi:tRNA A37 threonylcarbamoyladenosine biosynthesis protein TsaE